MEPTYTKEQLIKAWVKYCENARNNPEEFKSDFAKDEDEAKNAVEYLLSLI